MPPALSRSRPGLLIDGLCAVAFFEFLLAAAWAGIIAANVLQGVARRLLVAVIAVGAVHVVMVMVMVVSVIMVVIAVRAVDVFLLGHAGLLRDVIAGNYLAIARHVHAPSE